MVMIATKTATFSKESVHRTQRLLLVTLGTGSVAVFRPQLITYFPTPFDEVCMAKGAEDTIQE